MQTISDNWVVRNLENALATWNEKLAELWQFVTQIQETLVVVDYGQLEHSFAMGVFSTAASFRVGLFAAAVLQTGVFVGNEEESDIVMMR